MKIIVSLLLGFLLFTFAGSNLFAQYRKLTVILLRHAEKDISEDADSADPDLSATGKLRAQGLVKIIDKYEPDAIFSTNYIRTRATVMPLAGKRRSMIQIYDGQNLNQIADTIMTGKMKRIVIVGHSNTIPALANLLIKQDKYKTLVESEYDKIWIIKIKRNKRKPNKIKEKVIVY
jgi:broad specificity phosphatase PhoE